MVRSWNNSRFCFSHLECLFVAFLEKCMSLYIKIHWLICMLFNYKWRIAATWIFYSNSNIFWFWETNTRWNYAIKQLINKLRLLIKPRKEDMIKRFVFLIRTFEHLDPSFYHQFKILWIETKEMGTTTLLMYLITTGKYIAFVLFRD